MSTTEIVGYVALAVVTLLVVFQYIPAARDMAAKLPEFIQAFLGGGEEPKTTATITLLSELFKKCAGNGDCLCDYSLSKDELLMPENVKFTLTNAGSKLFVTSELGDNKIVNGVQFCFIESDPPYAANWNFRDLPSNPTLRTDVPISLFLKDGRLQYSGQVRGLGTLREDKLHVLRYHGMVCIGSLVNDNLQLYERTCNQLAECRRPGNQPGGYLCSADQRCDGVKDPFYTGTGTCCSIPCIAEGTKKQQEEASQLYQKALEAGNTNWQQAVKIYDELLATYPTAPEADDALFRKGQVYKQQGMKAEALATWKELLRRHPTSEWVLWAESESDSLLNCGDKGFVPEVFTDGEEEKKCYTARDSLLRGCIFIDETLTKNACATCGTGTSCSSISDETQCAYSPCDNVGGLGCVWQNGECTISSYAKACSAYTDKESCEADPCIARKYDINSGCCEWTGKECAPVPVQ